MRNPGIYRDYPSYMCSDYYCWFKDAGYPELDIRRWPDGEWAIIQYMRAPLIPQRTPWQWVLTGMRNVEINHANVFRLVDQIDLTKKQAWAKVDEGERKARELAAEQDRRAEDFGTRAYEAVRNNPDLMERVVRTGDIMQAIDPRKIRRHIPRSRIGRRG
jgi:hypothetical protein